MPETKPGGTSYDRRQLRRLAYSAAVIVVIVLIGLWWTNVYQSPSNVFWGLINNSLATTGATMHVQNSESGTKLNEYVQFELGAKNYIHSTVKLNEDGTEVNTETIGTPSTDFTRYTTISTKSATSYNSVVGVWAKSTPLAKGQVPDPIDHLFGQTVLGVVPYADLPASTRQSLVAQAQVTKVYTIDPASVTRTSSAYTYTVKIAPKAYAAFLQQVTKDEGLGSSSEFNPNDYQANSQPLTVQLSVSPVSRQLLAVNYGSGHSETINGYGIQPNILVPSHTITTVELQNRLEAIHG
jgi:hypothetical protein